MDQMYVGNMVPGWNDHVKGLYRVLTLDRGVSQGDHAKDCRSMQ